MTQVTKFLTEKDIQMIKLIVVLCSTIGAALAGALIGGSSVVAGLCGFLVFVMSLSLGGK